jgi:hypothetical protein
LENKNNKPVLNININKDDSSVNDFLYCWNKFGSRPNRVVLYNTYLTEEFNEVIQSLCKSKNSFTELIPSDDGESHTINDNDSGFTWTNITGNYDVIVEGVGVGGASRQSPSGSLTITQTSITPNNSGGNMLNTIALR